MEIKVRNYFILLLMISFYGCSDNIGIEEKRENYYLGEWKLLSDPGYAWIMSTDTFHILHDTCDGENVIMLFSDDSFFSLDLRENGTYKLSYDLISEMYMCNYYSDTFPASPYSQNWVGSDEGEYYFKWITFPNPDNGMFDYDFERSLYGIDFISISGNKFSTSLPNRYNEYIRLCNLEQETLVLNVYIER